MLLNYTVARFKKDYETKSYRVYVTNALRSVAKGDEYPMEKWVDLLNPPPEVDPWEVIGDIVDRAELVME